MLQEFGRIAGRGLEFEQGLQPLCVREEVGVIPYYSLAAGFLTGKYRSYKDLGKSPRGKGAAGRYFESGSAVLSALDSVAERLKANPTQVAIAWLNSRSSIAAPLASATSVEQLEDIIAGARLVLDAESLAQLERASKGL